MKNKWIIVFTIALFSIACNDNDDETTSINKDGAVETSVTVNHVDSLHDVLITKHRIWTHFNQLKDIEYRDTIPALGEANTTAKNKDGDTKSINVKKDYEIFITVK